MLNQIITTVLFINYNIEFPLQLLQRIVFVIFFLLCSICSTIDSRSLTLQSLWLEHCTKLILY